MKSTVNVVIPAHNEEEVIAECLCAILGNDYANFHVTLIDDASIDNTALIAREFTDSRLNIIVNRICKGPGTSCNEAARVSAAKYLFFLDADCIPGGDWITRGVAALEQANVCAVEGAIHYRVSSPSFRHKVPINPFYNNHTNGLLTVPGRDFASGNFGVDRQLFVDLGGFNSNRYLFGREDTDLGYRVNKSGKVAFCPKMKVIHKEEFWTLRSLLRNARRYAADVSFYKDHGYFPFSRGRILHPKLFLMLLVPPLILFKYPFRDRRDYLFLPQFYFYLLILRWIIWRQAIRERTFVL